MNTLCGLTDTKKLEWQQAYDSFLFRVLSGTLEKEFPMKSIKTIQEAQALPEVEPNMFETFKEVQSDGTVLIKDKVLPLVLSPIDGDDIILFTDKDNRPMQVVYTKDGPAKQEFCL